MKQRPTNIHEGLKRTDLAAVLPEAPTPEHNVGYGTGALAGHVDTERCVTSPQGFPKVRHEPDVRIPTSSQATSERTLHLSHKVRNQPLQLQTNRAFSVDAQ